MRFWTIPVLAGLLIVATAGAALAIPSLGGPTGIVSVPNASVAPMGSLETALSYQKAEIEAADMYSEDLTALSLQALTGVAEQAELWAAYTRVDNEDDTHVWGIGGKVALTKEPEEAAALAIGASYQNWADILLNEDLTVWKAYLVATKDFTPLTGETWEWGPGAGTRMLGSAGLMYIKLDILGESDSLTRPFVGLEFIGAGGTTLGLEYRWKDDDFDMDAVFSAVLRHKFSPEFAVEVGTTNAIPIGLGLDGQDIFVRLGYTIPSGGLY